MKVMRWYARWYVALCLIVLTSHAMLWHVAALTSGEDVGDDPLPTPQWTRTGCTPPFTECASVSTYKVWAQRNSNLLSFYVERVLADPVGAVTVWLVSDSTVNTNLVDSLRKAGVNVVHFHPRGGHKADPELVCSEETMPLSRNCWPDATCAQQLRNKGVVVDHYSIDHVARDLQWALANLGRGTHNVLLGEGLSAAVVTHYLLLFPQEATTDLGVILVDPVYPGATDGERFEVLPAFYRHVDAAAQHLLSLCDAQPQCAARLGLTGSAWARLQNVQRAVASGALPCIKDKRLQWVAADGRKDQARAVRETLAAMVSPPQFLAPSDRALMQLVPSFLYRLQRCADKDVRALNHLRDYVQSAARISACPANTPLYMSWLSNEFQDHSQRALSAGATAQTILDDAVKAFELTLVPGHSEMTSFVHFDDTLPHYTAPAHLWSGTYQGTLQVLLLTSDIDTVFAPGLAAKLTMHFGQSTAHQLRGGGAGHLPSRDAMRTCLVNHLQQYARKFAWGGEELCHPGASNGVDFIAADATKFYGVADPWEFTRPYDDEPAHGKARPDGENDATHRPWQRVKKVALVMTLLCLPMVLVVAVLRGWRWYRQRQRDQLESDNFYDYLH